MSVKGEKVNGVAGMLRTTLSVGGEFLTWWYKEKGVTDDKPAENRRHNCHKVTTVTCIFTCRVIKNSANFRSFLAINHTFYLASFATIELYLWNISNFASKKEDCAYHPLMTRKCESACDET